MAIDFGYSIRQTPDITEVPALASEAESMGFSTIWIPDSPLYLYDSYILLTICAERTSCIKLGPGVTHLIQRHPIATASAISTLNKISNGRAILGIGAGDSAARPLGIRPSTASELRRSIGQIRELCSGRTIKYNNSTVRLGSSSGGISICLAATGPLMLRLAGEVADAVIINVGTSKDLLDFALRNIRKGAETREKNLGKIKIICLATCALSEDEERAKMLARPYVGYFAAFNPSLLSLAAMKVEHQQMLREAISSFENDMTHADLHDEWQTVARKVSFITNDMVDKFTIAGDIDYFVKKIRELEGIGIDELFVRPFFTRPYDQVEGDQSYIIRSFGENIITHFR